MFDRKAKLLTIYVVERDRHGGLPLYEWIIQKAYDTGIAGASVVRGIGGYCLHAPVVTAALTNATVDPPVIVYIVEKEDKLHDFVKEIEEVIPEGLMTMQDISFKFCDKRKRQYIEPTVKVPLPPNEA